MSESVEKDQRDLGALQKIAKSLLARHPFQFGILGLQFLVD